MKKFNEGFLLLFCLCACVFFNYWKAMVFLRGFFCVSIFFSFFACLEFIEHFIANHNKIAERTLESFIVFMYFIPPFLRQLIIGKLFIVLKTKSGNPTIVCMRPLRSL